MKTKLNLTQINQKKSRLTNDELLIIKAGDDCNCEDWIKMAWSLCRDFCSLGGHIYMTERNYFTGQNQ